MRGTQNSRQGALAAPPPPVSPFQVVACGRYHQILALCFDRPQGPWFIDARRCVPLEAVKPHVGSQGFSYCFLCALPTRGLVIVDLYPSVSACHVREFTPLLSTLFRRTVADANRYGASLYSGIVALTDLWSVATCLACKTAGLECCDNG